MRLHAHAPGMALVFIDTAMGIHVVPDTAEARAAVLSRPSALHLHNIDVASGVLTGFKVVGSEKGNPATATQLWSMKFHPSTEKIAAVAPTLPHSRVSGLGDVSCVNLSLMKFIPHFHLK